MLLCLGIYGKVTKMGPNRHFQGPHLCKRSVQLRRMTESTSCIRVGFALKDFHLSTDDCGDANIGDQIDVTLKYFGVPVARVAFIQETEKALNDMKQVEPLS